MLVDTATRESVRAVARWAVLFTNAADHAVVGCE